MSLVPPKESAPYVWLRNEIDGRFMPAGHEAYEFEGETRYRWSLANGEMFSGQSAWLRGWRYHGPDDPAAIVPDPDNAEMVERAAMALAPDWWSGAGSHLANDAEQKQRHQERAREKARAVLAAIGRKG